MNTRHANILAAMRARMERLYPMCRSITGDGVRATLADVATTVPLQVHEVPSGSKACDWIVPREWNIRSAWIKDMRGNVLVDFAQSNLHVVNYSTPFAGIVSREELEKHLHSLPDRPTLIPYVTSYYNENWGFCVSDDQRRSFTDAEYEVAIDSTLADGHLSYGELLVPGESTEEVLLTTHVCHPSLANDNLTGIAMLAALGEYLLQLPNRRYTYRLLFIPGTIGSLTWLEQNRTTISNIKHGIVMTGLGDRNAPGWKKTRNGTDEVDRIMLHLLAARGEHHVMEYYPYGYDERQFTSPGFGLSVGRFGRGVHGEYGEYHTSADNLEFVVDESLIESYDLLTGAISTLEGNRTYTNLEPYGEPQLGRRGLYRSIGGAVDRRSAEMAVLWVLNQSDGRTDLLSIAARSGLPFATVREAADALLQANLLAVN
jgi:aminopeptidase-like protein